MKVCDVGARTALTQKFIDNGGINEDLKILDLNKVISTNDKLKSQLRNSFGIDRSIVNLDSKGEYISFNADVFNEIDALHGIYNDENKKYHKDYTNDNTLTPFQLISKYLDPASNDVGFKVSGELTQESLDKFKLGMSNEYPNILVKAVPTKIVDGEQKYKVALEKMPDAQPGAEGMAIPGGLDQVYDNVDKDVVMKTIAPLLSKFKNADVIWVSAADMNNILKNDPRVLIAKDKVVNAAAIGNKIYLVEGAVTTNTALEELMHLFVDSLLTQRKALFQGLVNEASANYPHIFAQVEADYAGFSTETKKIELVTRALRDAYVDERIKNPEGITQNQFLKLAKEFFKWLNSKFEDLFGLSFPTNTTIGQLAAYLNINDVEMPDVETVEPRFNLSAANEEFDQDAFDAEQPDPKNKTIKEKKLQRIKSQIRRLEKIKASLKGEKNKAMAETINKLIENSKEYQTLINDDTATVSVTKFVGSPEFPENISKVYKKYQDFGNFIHAFMEELQLKALALDLTPTQLLVTKPEFFDKFFDKHEDLISIPGLTKKKLFSHIALVVEKAGSSINNSEIVIPEITVHGVDSLGRVVDGRLDYIVVRQDGSVSIKDYKTTRSKFPMSRYNDSALTKLYSTKQLIEGVHPAFERFSGRSKVSGFLSQIGAYRRLLAQSGITSKGDSIINIIYSPDKTKLEDEDEWVYDKMFVNEVFVDGEYGLTMDKDENGNPIGELNPIAKRIIESLHAAIPVEGEETNTAAEEKVQEEINYIASLPNEKVKLLLDNLKVKIKLQLDNINTEISKAEIARADETTIRSLKERRALLREAQSWFDRTFKEGDEFVNVPDELILKGLLDKTKELAKSLSLDSERIYKEGDVKKTIQVLSSRNSQFNDLQNFLEAFQHALIYNAEISSDNPLIQEINQAIVDIKNGQSWYIKVAGEQFERVLLRVPKVNADRMIQSMRLMLEPKKAKLERIINGDTSVIDEKGMWFSGKLKRVISFLSGSPKIITQDMKEAAQEELTRINNFMKHPEYNKEFVKMYVENTFENPQSGFYIGSTVQQGFGGFTSDDFRSAYGNPELAITAMANYAIQMTEEAHAKFFEEMSKIDIDNIVKQFTSKYGSYQAGNQALSEKVSIKDLETGESEEYMMYNNPILREFFDKYDEFDYAIKKKGEEIKKLRESDLPQDQKDLQVKQLNKERDELKTKANDWRIENTETKLVPELYKLEVTLPEEIQEKINEMNQSIAAIKLNAKNQDWNLTESMLEDIKRYEFEISQLRKQARESNPEIDAILEKINEYYDYHVNEGLFEYNKDQVLKKFGEQSTEYKLWLERNSDLVPSSAWFDRIMELSEEKREIYGDDPEITALYEQRKELMNKYKYKSRFSSTNVFNPMFMSEEDMNALNEIDDAIDEYFGTKEPVKLDKEDNSRIIEINKELGAIKQTINKPEFTRQLNEKIDEIIRLNTEIGKESDPERKTHLEAQLKNKDLEFKAWYERNNTGKYKLGTIIQKGSVVAAPRKFNQISIPTDPGLMTRVPNSMYRTRSYKEAAYNPNYSPTLEKRRYGQGSYAMPKGIAYDKATGRFIVDKNSKWANPKYVSMMNDNTLMDFYNKFVMDQYYNKQINMSAQKLGFFFPAVQQKAFDTIATDGFEGIKREGREMVNDIVRSGNTSEFDKADNKYGVAGQNRVRFSHNYLQPASIVTKDGINAIIQWNLQYEINQSMEEANLALSPMVDFLKARKVEVKDEIAKKQIDKVIEIFEFERNKFIYGQTFAPSKDFEKSVINRKTMRQFMTAVSWGRLAFDPAMQVGNLVSGNVQAFLASQMKEVGMGSTEDFLFAKNQIYGTGQFFYNIISDYGKINDISLSTKILRFFNPTMKSMDKLVDVTNRSQAHRLLTRAFNIKDIAFVIQDKGEIEIGLTTLLKNLSAHKYNVYETTADGVVKKDDQGNPIFKKDGNGNIVQVSAFEALVDNGGFTPGIRSDVAMTMDDLKAIKAETHQEYLRHQGNYAHYTQTKIESSFMGMLLMFFRKYLVPAVEVRFKGAFGIGDPRNWIQGEAQTGWWTAMADIFKYYGAEQGMLSLLPGFVTRKSGKLKTNLYYQSKALQARREAMYATLFTFLYVSLRSMVYGDDDEKKDLTWAEMQNMRLMAKVANESRSLVPIPYIGKGEDYITNFATFTTAFNEGKTVLRAFENAGYYAAYETFDSKYAYERGYYQRRAGRYEAGTPKLESNVVSLTGLENILDIFNPEYAVKKQYQKKD